MARTSTSTLNEQNQILSNIDSYLTCLEKFPDDSCPYQSISVNPFSFLIALLFRLKKQDKLIEFLTQFLKKQIPCMEVTIKGILLSNLKKLTDCTLDPRIPDFARKQGITMDLGVIDMWQCLEESPLDADRNQLYMDCDTKYAHSPYSFLRSKDFNTFLWYVIHKGKYPNPSLIHNFPTDFAQQYDSNVVEGSNMLQYIQLSNDNIIEGNSFKQKYINGNTPCPLNEISVAAMNEYGASIDLFPIGEDKECTTYYVNRNHYFDFIKGETKRDYNKDVPLCSLRYISEVDHNPYEYYRKKINVRILDKPFVHIFNGATFILYDNLGNPNKNGSFTVRRKTDVSTANHMEDFWYYELENPFPNEQGQAHYLLVNGSGEYFVASTLTANADFSSQRVNEENPMPFLHECYPKLTVYEFNYDFVMSMRLLDAKVIVAQLINTLCYTNLGNVTLSLSSHYHDLNDKITSIVKKMIETDETEDTDCYFSFSNKEIEDRLHDADLKYANLVKYGDKVTNTSNNYDILSDLINEFAAETTLEKSTETLTKIVNQIEATISNENDSSEDKLKLHFGVLSSFTQNLATILVNSILTPKVLMIIVMNYALFGGDISKITPEKLIESMINVIYSIVKEIKDLIIKELLNYYIVFHKELLTLVQQKALLEQVNNYRRIIKKMLNECIFTFGKNTPMSTYIDNVNYADIDTEINQTEKNC